MTWYYALGAEQKGPVESAEFERLVQQGVVTSATLVWREGMADWRPYSELVAPPMAAPVSSVGGVVCSECRRSFAADQVIRLGSGYVCAGCKPIAVQKLREGIAVFDSGAEQIRKDHISHEASIKSVGVLYFLGAGIWLVAALGGFASAVGGPASLGGAHVPWIGLVVCLVLSGVLIWTGMGLRRLQRWARIPSGVLSGLGLLAFPIGTIINGYILYLLFSKKGATVFSDEYQRVIEETPHVKYRTSIVIWIFLGLLVFVLLLGLLGMIIGRSR